MPDLHPQHSQTPTRRSTDLPSGHRCRQCRQELDLVKSHNSPARLGPQMTTRFYQCPACDAGFAHNLATGTWRSWEQEDN